MKRFLAVLAGVGLLFAWAGKASAGPFMNSLWVGADPFNSSTGVLDMTRTGTVQATIDPFGNGGFANGIAVDVAGNNLYFGDENDLQRANLTTLANIGSTYTQSPPGSLPEDMTFDPTTGRIWRADAFNQTISSIIPNTGVVDSSFTVSSSTLNQPVGIAFDGSNLWIGGFANNRIEKFTTAGVDTGVGFTLGANFVGVGGNSAGGLAYDPTDNTLYIGTWNRVYHYDLSGNQLSFFNTPAGANRFVNGLEFEGAPQSVPEPSTLTLLVSGDFLPSWGCDSNREEDSDGKREFSPPRRTPAAMILAARPLAPFSRSGHDSLRTSVGESNRVGPSHFYTSVSRSRGAHRWTAGHQRLRPFVRPLSQDRLAW